MKEHQIVINPASRNPHVKETKKKQGLFLSDEQKLGKRFQRAHSNTLVVPPAHDPRCLVDRVISR